MVLTLILHLLPPAGPWQAQQQASRGNSEPLLMWLCDLRLKCYYYIGGCAGWHRGHEGGRGTRARLPAPAVPVPAVPAPAVPAHLSAPLKDLYEILVLRNFSHVLIST